MNKLTIHGDILSAAEQLERANKAFIEFKQYGSERLRADDVAAFHSLLLRVSKARKNLNKTLASFKAMVEPVEVASTDKS